MAVTSACQCVRPPVGEGLRKGRGNDVQRNIAGTVLPETRCSGGGGGLRDGRRGARDGQMSHPHVRAHARAQAQPCMRATSTIPMRMPVHGAGGIALAVRRSGADHPIVQGLRRVERTLHGEGGPCVYTVSGTGTGAHALPFFLPVLVPLPLRDCRHETGSRRGACRCCLSGPSCRQSHAIVRDDDASKYTATAAATATTRADECSSSSGCARGCVSAGAASGQPIPVPAPLASERRGGDTDGIPVETE